MLQHNNIIHTISIQWVSRFIRKYIKSLSFNLWRFTSILKGLFEEFSIPLNTFLGQLCVFLVLMHIRTGGN